MRLAPTGGQPSPGIPDRAPSGTSGARPSAYAAPSQPLPPFDPELLRLDALARMSPDEDVGRVLVHPAAFTGPALIALALVVLGISLATSVPFDMNGRGRGIVRPAGGIRVVFAHAPGSVVAVYTKRDDALLAQSPIIEIAPGPLRVGSLRLEALDEAEAQCEARVALLSSTAALAERVVMQGGVSAPLTAHPPLPDYRLLKESAIRQLAALRAERAELVREEEQARPRDPSKVSQTRWLRAPVSGRVDRILVQVGDAIAWGQPVARLVPDTDLIVVGFLPSRDRRFYGIGSAVRVSLDDAEPTKYIVGEVLSVSDDLASPKEARDALGEDARLEASAYIVEIRLSRDPSHLPAVALRNGMQATVSYSTGSDTLLRLIGGLGPPGL